MDNLMQKCEECGGCGWIFKVDENGYEVASECQCQKLKKAQKRIENSGLALVFRNKTFDNFVAKSKELANAKNKAQKFVSANINEGNNTKPSLLLLGQVGSGKTHLAAAAAVELLTAGTEVVCMSYRDDITRLKSKVMDAEAYEKEMKLYKTAPILMIDDFLKGRITDSDINVMYEIVNYRYNNMLPMIVTSEKHVAWLVNEWDAATATRLLEMSKGYIVDLNGERFNYRIYGGL